MTSDLKYGPGRQLDDGEPRLSEDDIQRNQLAPANFRELRHDRTRAPFAPCQANQTRSWERLVDLRRSCFS
jgi:hypothetical protein